MGRVANFDQVIGAVWWLCKYCNWDNINKLICQKRSSFFLEEGFKVCAPRGKIALQISVLILLVVWESSEEIIKGPICGVISWKTKNFFIFMRWILGFMINLRPSNIKGKGKLREDHVDQKQWAIFLDSNWAALVGNMLVSRSRLGFFFPLSFFL